MRQEVAAEPAEPSGAIDFPSPTRHGRRPLVYLRYWGSHFKYRRQVDVFASEFKPLVDRGWHCYLAMERAPADSSWMGPLTNLGIRMEYLPRPHGNFDWRGIRQAYALCRRIRPAVLHCENIHMVPLLGAALARVPVKVWTKRAMNSSYEEVRSPSGLERLAISTRLSCALATRVIAVSGPVRDELVGMGISEERILIRHNARQLGVVQDGVERDVTRKSWGCSASDIVVVSVGHAVPVKGWDILLRAFASTVRDASRLRLVLIGNADPVGGRFPRQLHDFILENKLSHQVHLTGHILDIQSALRAADVFAMPSRSEGFSVALIEALEVGLPCVASRVGIAGEVIQEGKNGFLVERGDEAALATALGNLAKNDALRHQCARNARVPASIPTEEEYAEQLACDLEGLLPALLRQNC
jgi:glycosyltransferase involved in cell wall biosynthesis